MTASALYVGRVMHRRLRPRMHQLDYRVFSFALDLDRVDGLASRLRLFSHGKFNLTAFHDCDFGDGSGASLKAQVVALCEPRGIDGIDKVVLVAMPRLLGFAFNPISLFFCHRADGTLLAIVYEVHNTFGERHRYVRAVRDSGTVRQQANKAFHVSPFLPMELDYSFRVRPPDEHYDLAITVRDDNGPLLVAVQRMERRELNDRAILAAALALPLMTLKVAAGILWEAARLWLKGVPIHPHPNKRQRGARTEIA